MARWLWLCVLCGRLAGAQTIDLELKDASARDALAAIEKQIGAKIVTTPGDLLEKADLPKVTMRVQKGAFWEAMKAFCAKTGLEPQVDVEDPWPRMMLAQGDGTFFKTPHAIGGPLLFVVEDMTRSNVAELGKKEHRFERSLSVSFSVYAQPGLKVLAAEKLLRVKEARDENGKNLVPVEALRRDATPDYEMMDTGVFNWDVSAQLDAPVEAGAKVAKLKCATHLRIANQTELVEFENVMKARNITRTVNGAPFTFKKLVKADIEYVLSVGLRRDRVEESKYADLHRSLYTGMMTLLDEKGGVVAARATENGGDYGPQRVDATLRFVREKGLTDTEAGEPFKLVWEAPLSASDVAVEFEMEGLPIPQ